MVTMQQATTVTANFVLRQYSLTVSKAGNGAGTVTGTGISCGSDCSEVVSHGTMVTLTASPSTGSTFTGWSNGCTGTGSCVVSMTQARSVTATFTLNTYTLTVARSGTGSGSVSSNPAGLTCPMSGSCTGTFNHGQAVVLSATPGSDSDFTSWSSSSCPGTGSCTLTITGNTSLTASFTLKQQPLTVTVNGTGSGTVTSSPGTINCMAGGSASACSATYTHGTMVTLTAAATSGGGNTFAAWGGACAGVMTSTCSVSMTQARTVSATFNVGSNNLTVVMDASATGMGTVTSNPAGISCSNTGGDCAENYTFGAMVTLTATPDTGSVFTGWSGGGCPSGSTSPCTVTMDAAKTVTAAFDLRVFTLTANVQSAGFGLVDTTDGVLSCDDSCADDYTYGEVVVIKATPNDGYNFNPATGWSNVCTIVDGGDCQVTMTAARTVTATFTPQIHTVTVQNTGGGSVDSDDGGITCGADCSGSYATGTEVTLTATPAVGYSFSGWTGVCNGEGPTCVFTVTQPETVSPIFTINTYTINASFVSPPGSGLITGASGAINCTSNSSGGCSTSIQHGTQVTLVAQHVAATKTRSGSRFLRWVSGPCASGSTASNPVCSATITGPTSFRAEYIRTWILTIELDAGIFTNNPTVAVTTAGGGTGSNMLCTESLSPCEFELDEGAVGMNAQPSARFRFWTGPPPCGGSNNNICGFAINAPTTYSADFL